MLSPPSNSIPIFILVSFTILLHAPNATAILSENDQLMFNVCFSNDNTNDTVYNYTSGSQYETNLNLLLSSLVSSGSGCDGYSKISQGVGSDIVYGLAQCNGDLSMEDCRHCLSDAAVGAIKLCPNALSATLRYEQCVIHYSNTRVFSTKYNIITSRDLGKPEYMKDALVVRFFQKLEVLLNDLSGTAASRPTRYSIGDTTYAPFKTVHGLVECRRDLSPSDCYSCLYDMIAFIPNCCNQTVATIICSETCCIKYDLDAAPAPSPATAPTFTFCPSPGTINEGKSSTSFLSRNIIFIILPIIASIMLKW